MALPRWEHVIGYEEGDPAVVDRLACGYPRFVFHPRVRELMALAGERCGGPGVSAFVFPSRRAAAACARYVQAKGGTGPTIADLGTAGAVAVLVADGWAASAKAFWQHSGLIVSSRRAAAALDGRPDRPRRAAEARRLLRERLATLYGAAPGDVFLFPSGMAAIHAAHAASRRLRPEGAHVQLEFPYLDTLKVQREFGDGAVLVTGETGGPPSAGTNGRGLAAIMTETPSNPLLRTADIPAAAAFARGRGGLLIVDDTIATPVNVDVTPWADLIAASLTKAFCGNGDVMAGALVVNPRSPRHAEVKAAIGSQHEDLLWGEDAVVLEERSRDFARRVRRANDTAGRLVAFLRGHPAVEAVYYPDDDPAGTFERIRRPDGGRGGLFSLLLADAGRTTPRFYDALEVTKGPSLGTDFTLACPYTLIAHYRELEWAEGHGVSRWLVRISVGLERPDDLLARFGRALAAAAPAAA